MKIFPSGNEKIITAVLVAMSVGLIIGLIVGSKITDANVVIASLATLGAAFIGSWFAFRLQDRAKQRKEIKDHVDKANELLFALFQKLNALKLFQIDSVDPWRDDPGRMIGMQPILDFKLPEAPFRPESISFLLKTKYKQLLFDAHIEEQRFGVAQNIIRHRSSLHYQAVQPALHAAGIVEGKEYTSTQYKAVLGELLYQHLKRSTDQVVIHVDETVRSGEDLTKKLIKALKEIYPDKEFIEFVLLEKTSNKSSKLMANGATV